MTNESLLTPQQQKNAQVIAQQASGQQGIEEDDKQQRARAPGPPHVQLQQGAPKPGVSGTRRKIIERGGLAEPPQGMSGSDRM